jgi:hypothetical protein
MATKQSEQTGSASPYRLKRWLGIAIRQGLVGLATLLSLPSLFMTVSAFEAKTEYL